MQNKKRLWSYIQKISEEAVIRERKPLPGTTFGQLFDSLCFGLPQTWIGNAKVGDLLLGKFLHAGAIFRATEDTAQVVEGAEASTLVCQHLIGQGFPQALVSEQILRLHPLRSDLRCRSLLVVIAQFPSTARFCREVFLLQRV